jgi:hypothetical protein
MLSSAPGSGTRNIDRFSAAENIPFQWMWARSGDSKQPSRKRLAL